MLFCTEMTKGFVILIIGSLCGMIRHASAQNVNALANNIQRQLNSEDAQYRQDYFKETPISERMLLDAGGTFRYAYNMIQNSRSQSQYLTTPDVRELMRGQGMIAAPGTPEQFAALLKSDGERYSRIAREANVRLD